MILLCTRRKPWLSGATSPFCHDTQHQRHQRDQIQQRHTPDGRLELCQQIEIRTQSLRDLDSLLVVRLRQCRQASWRCLPVSIKSWDRLREGILGNEDAELGRVKLLCVGHVVLMETKNASLRGRSLNLDHGRRDGTRGRGSDGQSTRASLENVILGRQVNIGAGRDRRGVCRQTPS
ncbi:hypothetical protein HYQ46_002680 [Verticillium longisporum]|nr:hypothetical protein HYQ46_002680 [Verticillium longisporum]